MRALVTGANGFVGRYLVDHLLSCGDEVIGTYLGSKPVDPRCEMVPLDICEPASVSEVLRKYRPKVVYHLAGMAFVPDAEADFEKTLRVNVAGTAAIFRHCHLLDLGATVVYVSSAEVYGKLAPADLPVTEETPVRPATNYGLSKRMAELVAERYDRLGTVRGVVVRPFNHLGAGQDGRFVAPSFALQLARLEKESGDRVIDVGNLEARRDFSDVRDIVRGYRLAAEHGRGVYNLGSGTAVSIRELLDTLIQISGVPVSVRVDPARVRPAEVPEVYGSFERAKRELDWTPYFTLKDTLKAVWQDARERA